MLLAASCNLGPGYDPYGSAAMTCDVERLSEQLADGADPNGHGELSLPVAWIVAEGTHERCLEAIQLLVEAGADVTRLHEGQSILVRVAAFQEDPAMLTYLLEQGADPCHVVPGYFKGAQQRPTELAVLAERRSTPEMAEAFRSAAADCPAG